LEPYSPEVENSARLIALRRKDRCAACSVEIALGTRAWWDPTSRTVTCVKCVPQRTPTSEPPFEAGRSAQRTADRRRAGEADEWKSASLIKKAVIAWQDKPSRARSWSRGAEGERIVGARLDQLQQEGLIVALHDIRVPRSSANVDHVAVAPSGIHVIDAKYYKNQQIEIVDRGGWLKTDLQLRVARRNRTGLIDKLAKQILTVDAVTQDLRLPTVVTPVLCFVDALWGVFKKEHKLNGVHIVPPPRLERLLRRTGPLTAAQIQETGDRLRERLRPA
jgi:hypothetical protein